MATRTFVADGTSRNWSATTSWAEGQVPTAADDVVFSTNVASSTLVIDGTSGSPSLCKSIDTTNYTRTITMGSTAQINVGGSTSGAFKMTAGMTFVPNATSLVKFVSTTTGNNITFGGYAFGNMTYDGVGGGWQWQDTNTMASNGTITLTNGSLDTNSQSITNRILFSSSNSNTRSLTLGTTNWSLSANSSTVWDITNSTGMTLSAASSTITNTAAGATSNITFAGGGLTYGTFTSTGITTSGSVTFTGANTWGTLTCSMSTGTKTTVAGYFFPSGLTTTVTGTFTAAGNSLILRNLIAASTVGTAATISAGTFTITNTDLRDITKAGAGSGNISATSASTGNGDCGGNTGWTFQAPRNVYMKTAVSVNWSAANWFTTSGGSTAATPPLPLCHDTNAVFDINSVTASGKTITVDQPRISGFTFSGVANNPTFLTNTEEEVYGSVVLVSGMTHTGGANFDLMGRGSFTLDGGTLTWPTTCALYIGNGNLTGSNAGITYSLARNLTSNSQLNPVNGTLNLNGFNWSGTSFNPTGGGISGIGTLTGTSINQTGGTITLGGTMTLTSTLTVSGGTLDMNGNQITGHTTATISSAGTLQLSGQLNGSGAISVTGGTINNTGPSGELKGTTGSFSGGTSTVKKLTLSSTMAQSGSSSLTFPAGGSATWATSWTDTGTSFTRVIQGSPTWSAGSLSIVGLASTFG